MNKEVDCRGLHCPQPVINTKNALDEMKEGTLIVIVDNEVAKENIRKLAQKSNASIEIENKEGQFHLFITKENQSIQEKNELEQQPGNGEFVILIGNDRMGIGAEELGDVLMKGYLYTLTEVNPKPDQILFVNNGVKLNCTGSPSIENIRILEEMGVEILSCGTCLDYYGLKEELQVGNISNMYTIVESLNEATKSIVL